MADDLEKNPSLRRGWWKQPVPVLLSGVATVTNVSNTHQAARVLLQDWPMEPGPKHLAARRAVLKAMESALDAKRQAAARTAFEEAAREAGIAMD